MKQQTKHNNNDNNNNNSNNNNTIIIIIIIAMSVYINTNRNVESYMYRRMYGCVDIYDTQKTI